MNSKTVKILIAVFSAIIVIFFMLMALNYYYGPGRPARPQPGSVSVFAEKVLTQARVNARTRELFPPSYRTGLSTESIRSAGAIMLVRSEDFKGVAEKPQDMLEILTGMSGSNKKKAAPVRLTEKDLTKKIFVPGSGKKEPSAGAYAMPQLGDSSYAQMGVMTMIKAPVAFEVFKTSETWSAFASSHKGHFPDADFSREQIVILVSASELPNGIFKITEIKKTARNILVRYRVDPLAMSSESKSKEYDFYSAAAIPKTALPVRLEQAP